MDLIDAFGGDHAASTRANDTAAFNTDRSSAGRVCGLSTPSRAP
jgi:hypothetical protein